MALYHIKPEDEVSYAEGPLFEVRDPEDGPIHVCNTGVVIYLAQPVVTALGKISEYVHNHGYRQREDAKQKAEVIKARGVIDLDFWTPCYMQTDRDRELQAQRDWEDERYSG